MKVLVVCSGNAPGFDFKVHQAFIYDQIEAVCKHTPSVRYECFFIKGKGVAGYIRNFSALKQKINSFKPGLIHAHGGLTGLLCGMQRRVPVVVTFHGSDINQPASRLFSFFASLLCNKIIFVSSKLKKKMSLWGKRSEVIPCGVDLDVFLPGDQTTAKRALGFNEKIKFALFSSAFNIKVKNYLLAEKGFSAISGVQLEEIKNRTREEVKLFLNAAEFLLLTSFSEGSPQIIKEAMACNCPIVATDVGDIREVIGDTEGCYLTSFDPKDVAEKIKLALAFGKRTNGHEKIGHLDNRIIAEKIIQVYRQVLEKEFKG